MYMAKNQEIGKLGEDIVVKHLQGLGWQILERNKMVPGGEIDIIAKEPKTKILVFIEVKAQASVSSGFKPEGLKDPRCGENLYKSYGRGVLLIKSYMDFVEYIGSGKSVHLIKYKNKPVSSQ